MRPDDHPFVARPNRTLVALTLPVLGSLIAEPLTGLVDTFFVGRLGESPLAALGVAATLLSGSFWVFNFLSIGSQTEVAQAAGRGDHGRAPDVAFLAMGLGAGIGVLLCVGLWPLAETLSGWMGARGETLDGSATYLRIRLLGAPAVLVFLAGTGSLRGREDMRTPLWLALGMNLANVGLDAVLIFGWGPFPRLELAGAAWASIVAQWGGALLCVAAVERRLGRPAHWRWEEARRLLVVGRDLFLRTGTLLLFLTLSTASANHLGTASGAAHQAARSVWTFTAFGLDAFAIAGQSLIGVFIGAGRPDLARQVAALACRWGLAMGSAIALVMAASTSAVTAAYVPPAAQPLFRSIWWIAALSQPLNALSFVTDGIHWGTGDYRFLRNAMLFATTVGSLGLGLPWLAGVATLDGVWYALAVWIAVRAFFGVARVWPGIGRAPLGPAPPPA